MKMLECSTNFYYKFWEQLDGILPDLNELHKLGLKIIGCNKKIDKLWKKTLRINHNYTKIFTSYGRYIKEIRNDEGINEKSFINGNYNMKFLENDYNLMFSDDTVILVISTGSRETQGRIVNANSATSNLFQYNSSELIGQDVSMLMPSIIANRHNQLLDQYFKTGI